MKNNKVNFQNVGNAGEYYIAAILSANGFTTNLTLGRAEKYDLFAVNNKNNKFVKIQVKTLSGEGCQWRMSPKDGKIKDGNLFYVFVRLNNLKKEPEYWVFSSKIVADYITKNHKKWLKKPGLRKRKHKDGPWRSFRIKSDKYTPKDWTEKCKPHYKDIHSLLK